MKRSLIFVAIATALLVYGQLAHAVSRWIDVTSEYIVNPSFDGNSNHGWTFESNAHSKAVRCGAMEFWNGTFDIHQTLQQLPAGHYRLSVSSFYRCQDNDQGYQDYSAGRESIPAVVYAGQDEQKLVSVYSWSSSVQFSSGTWSPWWVRPSVYFPNTMESATAAFEQGGYANVMEFEHRGGNVNIGLRNTTFVQSNWCIFDNFKLEYYGEIVPVSEVKIVPASSSLVVGESLRLQAVVVPDNATIRKLDWATSNAGVATVDENGNVTTKGEGQVTITATSTDGSGVQGSAVITVEHNVPTAGSLVINEIMAANVDQFISPAFNFDGWVELYNPTGKSVELGGIYLSDDASNLQLWRTPATMGVVPAHGFATVWFDSNNLNGNQAPFKLDMDGGTIILSNADGEILAKETYPEAMERVSYARTSDGEPEWQLTDTPTPSASNAGSVFAMKQLDAPEVDKGSCLFTGQLAVHVNIPEGTTLRYTTDGTLPTLYNGETSVSGDFSIAQTRNFRFRLFQRGKLASVVTTRSYILKDKDYRLPVVSVVTDPEFLYNDSIGVYVKGVNGRPGNGQSTPCNWNMDWERPVNFSWITVDNEMGINQDVNLEMCGGWSRSYTPHSFKLKGAKEYGGNKRLDYPFFPAKPFIRNRTLQIRNGGNDNVCRIKDPALQTIIQTSGIDIDLQSYQPVHEFINGQYVGVLNVREPNNKHYVFANYGWDDDEIDQFEMSPDSGYVQKCGTDEAFNLWHSLSGNAADGACYNEIKRLVDIDEYINYMAMEFYLGSFDWPQNNIKGFRKSDDGKFRFVSFDLDGAFSIDDSFNAFMNKANYTFDLLYGCPVDHITAEIKMVTIFRNMLANNEFKKKFIDTYCLMGGSVFEPARTTSIIDSLTAIVGPEMSLKNESPYATARSLKQSFNNRVSTAIGALCNLSTMGLRQSLAQSATLSSNVAGAALYVNGIEVPTGRFDGKLFAPVRLRASAPAGYVFRGWKKATTEGGTSSTDEGYYSTDAETDMPAGDFSLVADFAPMEDGAKAGFTPIRINEIGAANDTYVNEYAKKSDWVELYNTTSEPLDVEGMYLTNSLKDLKKSQLTKGNTNASTVIPAHGYLVVWCDKRDTKQYLHTSFKLDDEGGTLALTAADMSWTDSLSYPAHDAWHTVGRYVDGGNDIYLMSRPTIGAKNMLTSYNSLIAHQTTTGIDRVGMGSAQSADLNLHYAAGRLVIHGNLPQVEIGIYTLSGQMVSTAVVNMSNGVGVMQAGALESGCFVAKAMGGEGRIAVCKFVK